MKLKKVIAAAAVSLMLSASVLAASTVYTVKSGDTAWKIANNHSITISALQQANPGVKDMGKLTPGQKLTIPDSLSSYESQVITLVNQQRAKYGLMALKKGSTTSYVAGLKA